MKYISFIISVGGDTDWCFTNQTQWGACSGQLLFDASKFTNKEIHDKLKVLGHSVYEETKWKHIFSEICDEGLKLVVPFINNTKGVYVNGNFEYRDVQSGFPMQGWRFTGRKKKIVIPTEDDEIVPWNSEEGEEGCWDIK